MGMEGLEEISDGKNCYFVDLFVRVSNKIAINFYQKLGYTVYRTVLQYYSGDNEEDAHYGRGEEVGDSFAGPRAYGRAGLLRDGGLGTVPPRLPSIYGMT